MRIRLKKGVDTPARFSRMGPAGPINLAFKPGEEVELDFEALGMLTAAQREGFVAELLGVKTVNGKTRESLFELAPQKAAAAAKEKK